MADKPPKINGLPLERQKKVRVIRARLKKGDFCLLTRVLSAKTIDSLYKDIMRAEE